MSENPRAFPSAAIDDRFGGMSLRDWFAGQAIVAMPHIGCGADLDFREIAHEAYRLADAMLAQRSSGQGVE